MACCEAAPLACLCHPGLCSFIPSTWGEDGRTPVVDPQGSVCAASPMTGHPSGT